MDDSFYTQDTEDILNDTIIHLYKLTYPAGGMEDYIFFDKNEAIDYLKEHFHFINLNDPDPTEKQDVETYHNIMHEIENMKHFIAFKVENIEDYFVDDYTGYIKDLFKQIFEAVEYYEWELEPEIDWRDHNCEH